MTKRPSLVYFIKPIGMDGPIKIGCSSIPADRLKYLSVWSPWPLEIIGAVPGSYADEYFLHKCFADIHSHREWFFGAERLRVAIDAIISANSVDAVRSSLTPIRSIKKKRILSKEERKWRSYRARVRIALDKLCVDNKHERIYYTQPLEIRLIFRAWDGYSGYREPRKPIEPSREQIGILEAFITDPVGNGAERHVIPRINHVREQAA